MIRDGLRARSLRTSAPKFDLEFSESSDIRPLIDSGSNQKCSDI